MCCRCLGIIRAAGLGWAGLGLGSFCVSEKIKLSPPGLGTGKSLTKKGPEPRTVTAPDGSCIFSCSIRLQGYKYLLGSSCTSSHCNRNHNHSME